MADHGWNRRSSAVRTRNPLRTRTGTAAAALAVTLLATAACSSDSGDEPDDNADKKDGPRISLVLRPARAATPDELARSQEILLRRLEFAGVENAEVRVENDGIVVIAAAADRELLDGIETNGRLDFRPVFVAEQLPTGGGTRTPSPSAPAPSAPAPSGPAAGGPVSSGPLPPAPTITLTMTAPPGSEAAQVPITAELTAAYNALDCTTPAATADAAAAAAAQPEAPAATCADHPKNGAVERFILGPSRLSGADLTSATAQLPADGQPGGWEVALSFNSAGRDKFTDITGKLARSEYPTTRFAIALDGRVIVAPTVREQLTDGNAVVSGDLTEAEAKRIAAQLKSGTLPVAFIAQPPTAAP